MVEKESGLKPRPVVNTAGVKENREVILNDHAFLGLVLFSRLEIFVVEYDDLRICRQRS